jgi:hypothetical protein
VLGLTHVVPQVPQLLLSVCRFVHVPAQFVNGASQSHVPPSQSRLPPQAAPQNEQFSLLLVKSAHTAPRPTPHWVAGVQEMTHDPFEQSGAAAGHAVAHAPQFALSDVR